MKLTGAKATNFLAQPEPSTAGILLFGQDASKIALKRKKLIVALAGETAEQDMRLTRMTGAELRKDPANALDAMKSQGFFPGHRIVFIEEAGDGNTNACHNVLSEHTAQDGATLIVTAGALPARSKLRKLFETSGNAICIGIYDDPMGRDELMRELDRVGLNNITPQIVDDLLALARDLDTGDFNQMLEKLSLYKLNDDSPISADDIDAVMPQTATVDVDDAITLVADAKSGDIAPMIQKLSEQGVNPTTLCISATRHFRMLHTVASDPSGVDAALSRLRPPVFGPRRERVSRQVKSWGIDRLERALSVLMETDLTLRSSRPVPTRAVLERAFIRIAMLRR